VADCNTKPLPINKFRKLNSRLRLNRDISVPGEGVRISMVKSKRHT
jgi:hypothetical protein